MDEASVVTYTVFNVRGNVLSPFRQQPSGPEWKITPPVNHGHRRNGVTIRLVGPGSHTIDVYSDVFEPAHATGTNSVTVTIRSDVDDGYYQFEVYVDGQYVNANSAPGIIVD